jgi:REP element-mobilizing transposase RayT
MFGNIADGIMVLNNAGRMAHQCWLDIPKHFPHVVLHEFIIMPDHVHGIIELNETVGANNYSPLRYDQRLRPLCKRTVGSIVRGFKIGVTKWMRQHTDVHDVWQRNYYDKIIRDSKSYDAITTYIRKNPEAWKGA